VGPAPILYLATSGESIFPNTSFVFCGAVEEMAGSPTLDSHFTGTWLHLDIEKTIDVALRLFPQTRHIAVVGGASLFDNAGLSVARKAMKAYESNFDVSYLTGLPMDDLLARLQRLPASTIILYTSFFRDVTGVTFVNATAALPMVANASNAPVFSVADSYLGHGIVGGDLMSFAEQGRIATRIVSSILAGKQPNEIPIYSAPNVYMFDWRELRRWKIKERMLPAGSIVEYREWSFWERTRWIWITVLSVVLALATLVIYLLQSLARLKLAKHGQLQLSGLLINAQEKERSRLASELHDDFSQRLALLALGLANAEEAISVSPQEATRQLHELLNSTSEIGADIHTLSHRLHSASLESLGLVLTVAALCKEFSVQQGIKVDFQCDDVPREISPNASLCVFRIIQESLRNLKKYSGVKEAVVILKRSGDRLEVTVHDEGLGFDIKTLTKNEGLGIRSMAERARLVGGEFKIHSVPGRGTTVEAWIPIRTVKTAEDES
jgi:signal transduction histidine kinase